MHTATPATLADVLDRHAPALVVVELDDADWSRSPPALAAWPGVVLGHASLSLPREAEPWLEALTLTVAPGGPGRAWVDSPLGPIKDTVAAAPVAASTLATLLPVVASTDVVTGLVAESLAYSMLLAGGEFGRWRAANPARPVSEAARPVLVERDGPRLLVTLDRPDRRNAFGRAVRDGLLEALGVAELDRTIDEVMLRGAGPAFCSGGDLDEFGIAGDVAAAHGVRLRASAGYAVHRLRERVRPRLHGACIGAGIEVPAFADHVVARRDAWFQLPELSMGLVPGAGGTVSISRRIGRWRTAWLALSGQRIDAETACAWGLVDELDG